MNDTLPKQSVNMFTSFTWIKCHS